MTTTRTARRSIARGFSDRPKLRGELAISWRLVMAVVILAVLVALTGCQTFPQAEASLRTGISANAGHAGDENLPAEAHTIAEKNHDLMWKVLFNIGGCEEADIPEAVRERQRARERARSGERTRARPIRRR